MTYEEFLKFVPAKCIYETLYEDTEGRPILVISLLDAYDMVDKAQRQWVGLTDEEIESAISDGFARGLDDGNVSNRAVIHYVRVIEAALKERNHD